MMCLIITIYVNWWSSQADDLCSAEARVIISTWITKFHLNSNLKMAYLCAYLFKFDDNGVVFHQTKSHK